MMRHMRSHTYQRTYDHIKKRFAKSILRRDVGPCINKASPLIAPRDSPREGPRIGETIHMGEE